MSASVGDLLSCLHKYIAHMHLPLEADELPCFVWSQRRRNSMDKDVLPSFSKQWRTYCVLDLGNAEINGTQPSGEIGMWAVISTCSDRDRNGVMGNSLKEALAWARSHRSSLREQKGTEARNNLSRNTWGPGHSWHPGSFMQMRSLAWGFTVFVSWAKKKSSGSWGKSQEK